MAGRNAKKRCIHCNKVWDVTEFMPNRAWGAQQNCDLYCRQCTKAMVVDKTSFRKYMWENNRMYTEAIWDTAKTKAKRVLANNVEYNRKSTSETRRTEIAEQVTATQALSVMTTGCRTAFRLMISARRTMPGKLRRRRLRRIRDIR